MNTSDATARQWCEKVAAIVADALIDGRQLAREQFGASRDIVAEELFARLAVGDYPPTFNDVGREP